MVFIEGNCRTAQKILYGKNCSDKNEGCRLCLMVSVRVQNVV